MHVNMVKFNLILNLLVLFVDCLPHPRKQILFLPLLHMVQSCPLFLGVFFLLQVFLFRVTLKTMFETHVTTTLQQFTAVASLIITIVSDIQSAVYHFNLSSA